MTTMAPPRPAERHERHVRPERHEGSERHVRRGCRVRLATGPAAPAEARRRVRDAIRSWQVPVDLDAALLLTSELLTNAIRHEAGQGARAVTLAFEPDQAPSEHRPCRAAVAVPAARLAPP